MVGEHGAVSLAHPAAVTIDTQLARSESHAPDWRPRFADAYRLELQAWVTSINDRGPSPLATGMDGLIASAVSDAVITSMKSGGRWVTVTVPHPFSR